MTHPFGDVLLGDMDSSQACMGKEGGCKEHLKVTKAHAVSFRFNKDRIFETLVKKWDQSREKRMFVVYLRGYTAHGSNYVTHVHLVQYQHLVWFHSKIGFSPRGTRP